MKRSNVRLASVLTVAVMAASVILGACSGGGGGTAAPPPAKIQLSGTIASGGSYTFGTFGKGSLGKILSGPSTTVIDAVIAIPMDRGDLDARNMPSSVPALIGADGTFSLALSQAHDWLLVLIDSTAAPEYRFVDSLAINAGTDTMLSLPATVSTFESLNLGTIDKSGGDAVSSATVTASDFGMTSAQLAAMTKSDDVFKNAKNIINNYDTTTGVWYQLRPDFEWTGNYATIATAFTGTAWEYNCYHFQMDTNATNLTIKNLCTNGTNTVLAGWTPPTDITTVGDFAIYSPSNPIMNSLASCETYTADEGQQAIKATGGAFFATNAYWGPYGTLSYSVSSWLTGTIPPGNWTWSEDGVVKATFDPSVSTPVAADGVRALGYVPSIKLTVDGATQVITAVDVEWYFFDDSIDDYRKVETTDLAAMMHIMARYEIIFDASSRHGSFDLDPTAAIQHIDLPATGPDVWTYADMDSGTAFETTDAEAVGVFYSSGGIGRYFFARATMTN